MKSSANVTKYIAKAPAWARPVLRELRKTIRAAAPKAREKISYHMPYYGYHGRLAYFAAFKSHCSFFWIGSADKKKFKEELSRQHIVGSTLRILKGEKVPTSIIKKIVKVRAKRNEQKIIEKGSKICSRGHAYKGKGCPICWKGFRK